MIGAPQSGHFTWDGQRVPGLNWLEWDGLELDTDWSEAGRVTPWPTSTRPYVVGGGGGDGKVVVRLPDRSTPEVDVEEFVELVAAYVAREGLGAGTPIVLAVPFLGRYGPLLQRLADRTGLVVWPHSGEVKVSALPDGKGRIDTVVVRPGVPKGAWFPLRPGVGPVLDESVPGWYRDVVIFPMVSAAIGAQMGYSSFSPAEYANFFEENERHSDRMTTYVDRNSVLRTFSPERELPRPGPEGSPFPEAHAIRVSGHGIPGYLVMVWRSGDSFSFDYLDEDEAPAFVAWLVSRQPKDRWIDFACCSLASPKDSNGSDPSGRSGFEPEVFVADPLRELSLGQHIVDAAGRWGRASYGPQTETTANGKYVRLLTTEEKVI